VVVTWVLAIMMIAAFGAAQSVRATFLAESTWHDKLRAEWLARAGVERAAICLAEDDRETDSVSETWAKGDDEDYAQGELGAGGFQLVRDAFSDDGAVHYGIMDEARKLNVNTVTREVLLEIPEMTEEIADSIIDWRDKDSECGPAGAETDYYSALEVPYDAKDAAFETARELLLVRGIEPELFYGEDRNGDGVLDENEDDGDETAPDDDADGVLDRGFGAYLTASSIERNEDASGQKRVNITSASESDLTNAGFSSDEAKSIVEHRKKGKFTSIADLLDVELKAPTVSQARSGRSGSGGGAKAISESRLRQLADKLTVSDGETLSGRLNINTAPVATIEALFGDETVAQAVHDYARSEEGPFKTIADLLLVEEVSQDVLKKVANYVTVRSNVFHVRSVGYVRDGDVRSVVEALLLREGEKVRIVSLRVIQ